MQVVAKTPHKINQLFLSEGNYHNDHIVALCQSHQLKVVVLTKDELTTLVKTDKHQGIVIDIKPFTYLDLPALIDFSKHQTHPLLLMVDQIQDPGNLGAIIRTSEIMNVDGVIMLQHRQSPVNATVFKTSAGAVNFINICQVVNLKVTIKLLKAAGYWIVGATLASQLIDAIYQKVIDYQLPLVLIVGNEGKGITPNLLPDLDIHLHIPMLGITQSLNVAAATSILLYYIRTKQKLLTFAC